MKRLIAILLAMLMLAALTGCGGETSNETTAPDAVTEAPSQTEAPAEETEAPAEETEAPAAMDGDFCFTYEGVALIPNEAFDASKLPAATSVYTVPSCALEGTDNVYNYGTFEVTAFNDGSGEFIYSIVLIDPNITTDEGLALGDNVSRVIELYGENYQEDGTAMVYYGTNTVLSIIVQGEYVVDIEIRMAN